METKAVRVGNSLNKAHIKWDEDDDDLCDPIHKKNTSSETGQREIWQVSKLCLWLNHNQSLWL